MVRSGVDSRPPGTHRNGAFSPGTTFAGYRVESLVGRGGMGVVYRAWDMSLDRRVALKLIAPELAQDERFRTRFLRESRLAASLDHPHVVPIHEAGERDGQLYLAMRYVEGSDLRTLLDREGKLSPERALGVLAQIADALDAAHRRGLVHRDVKPGNVLLDEDGHAYLSDFGITKQVGGASTDTGRVVGTLDYLAPEQIRGEAVDGRTDCYALACVLYECLSGEPPFRRDTEAETLWAHMQDEPPSLHGHPDLDPVLGQALAKDKEARHANCGELLAAASSALGFEPPARRARRLRIGRRLLLAGGLLLVAAAAAVVVPELTGDRETARGGFKPVSPDSVAVLDPDSNQIVDEVRIPGRPGLACRGRSIGLGRQRRRRDDLRHRRSLALGGKDRLGERRRDRHHGHGRLGLDNRRAAKRAAPRRCRVRVRREQPCAHPRPSADSRRSGRWTRRRVGHGRNDAVGEARP